MGTWGHDPRASGSCVSGVDANGAGHLEGHDTDLHGRHLLRRHHAHRSDHEARWTTSDEASAERWRLLALHKGPAEERSSPAVLGHRDELVERTLGLHEGPQEMVA